MSTPINALIEGRCPDFMARITELDARPITAGEGKPVVIFHFVVTDATKSMQCTAWDQAGIFHTLITGKVYIFSGLTAKPVKGMTFRDFGDLALNFGKQSRAIQPLACNEADYPSIATRVSSRQVSTAAIATPTPQKRSRETSPCCSTPNAPFCGMTGRAHQSRCDICQNIIDASPFCPLTGLPHL